MELQLGAGGQPELLAHPGADREGGGERPQHHREGDDPSRVVETEHVDALHLEAAAVVARDAWSRTGA